MKLILINASLSPTTNDIIIICNNVRTVNRTCRLLDVQSVDGRYAQEMVFYLVFEHMERDLDSFIRTCPPPGMGIEVIKVSACMQVE